MQEKIAPSASRANPASGDLSGSHFPSSFHFVRVSGHHFLVSYSLSTLATLDCEDCAILATRVFSMPLCSASIAPCPFASVLPRSWRLATCPRLQPSSPRPSAPVLWYLSLPPWHICCSLSPGLLLFVLFPACCSPPAPSHCDPQRWSRASDNGAS
jgi:hypothetical protein